MKTRANVYEIKRGHFQTDEITTKNVDDLKICTSFLSSLTGC
jgi:hypothetical protein